MKFPKISIVTINFNNDFGLKRTLESVVNQTYKNIEYLVVDGASSDKSIEYIKMYQHYIDFLISEKDSGIYNAMNKGLKQVTGDYVLFLNSGDWLVHHNVIEVIAPKLKDNPLVYGNLINVFSDTNKKIEKGANGKELTLKHFFYGASLPFPAMFISKTILDNYGEFDENYRIVSDWKFFIETIIINDIKPEYIDMEITNFDMNGISNSHYSIKVKEHELVLKELFPLPIIKDYIKSKHTDELFKSNRFKLLRELENSKKAQKTVSAIFRILLKIFRKKNLSDL